MNSRMRAGFMGLRSPGTLATIWLLLFQSAFAQISSNQFSFDDYLLAPVRVHLLSAADSPAISTSLAEPDIIRIFGKLNSVWAQAGLHFYLESIIHEESAETCPPPATQVEPSKLLRLRPAPSMASNLFNVYYLKAMPNNG